MTPPSQIQLLCRTWPTPQQNLAAEEALLEWAENGGGRAQPGLGVLRLWESPVPFVVLGAGGSLAADVNLAACASPPEVPVLRRCTGGGTVVQGPGCLNFTFVLPLAAHPQLSSIEGTNRLLLGCVADAIAAQGEPRPAMRGTSDLVSVRGRKFSGNAQRRKRAHVLFHGTILYRFDLGLISRCLAEPPRQPEYRAERPHAAFVENLPRFDPIRFATDLASQCGASGEPAPLGEIEARLQHLADTKYSDEAWITQF